MTYADPYYMGRVAPHCHIQVPILAAIGKGPKGDQGPKGDPSVVVDGNSLILNDIKLELNRDGTVSWRRI